MNIDKKRRFPNLGGRFPGRLYLFLLGFLALLFLAVAGAVTAQSGAVPAEPPDATSGESLHGERCANCHGPTGQGDGELAANLPNPPAAHASTEYLRAAVPSAMFDVVTNGIIPQGMPPFGPESSNPLSDAERWDAIAAIYSFGTPINSVELGQAIYEDNCLDCHGEGGLGDGSQTANLETNPGDLTDLEYWFNISNQSVFDTLAEGQLIADHQYELGDQDLWSVTDYIRTFSYGYADLLAPYQPLEFASVSGQVLNASTGDFLSAGAEATLRSFTQDLDMTLTMTDTLDSDGRFLFDLTDVPQDWFFRVGLDYDDVEFGSDFGQVTFDEPDLDLPITVYDKTSDPSAINVEQLHTVLVFDENAVIVSELYVVSNNDATVFVGRSGDSGQGTFEIGVPAGAEDLSFQRGFGSIDSFIPASEVISTESGWADTLPLRPGPGSLTILVQYTLPYQDEATISHPVNYATGGVNLVVPDVGVAVDESDGWVSGGTQSIGENPVTTYGQFNVLANSELVIALSGDPRSASGASVNVIGDNATELVVGLGAAALVIGLAAVVIHRWRLESEERVEEVDPDDLIQMIADLDDAYETGEIGEEEYHRERDELKAELVASWEDEP